MTYPQAPPAPGEQRIALALLATAALVVAVVWAGAALAALIHTRTLLQAGLADAANATVVLIRQPSEPASAWPLTAQQHLPGPTLYWPATAAIAIAVGAAGGRAWRKLHRRPHPLGIDPHPTIGRSPVSRRLRIRRPTAGRLTLGTTGRALVAAEAQASVCVIGPTGCGKTAGFAIPALLEWSGPALVASVKTDLLAATIEHRRRRGRVWVYDPTGTTREPSAGWSPIDHSRTWADAQRTATWLCDAARDPDDGLTDGDYWFTQARKALAPHLYAAGVAHATIADVVRWIDTEEQTAVEDALALTHTPDTSAAVDAARALWAKEERIRSSIYATVENLLVAYADPGVTQAATPSPNRPFVHFDEWLDGDNTIYLVAPTHEQQRLRPVLTVLAQAAIRHAFDLANHHHGALPEPCLVLLDEAGNTAPLPDLHATAATARSHNITVVDIWQDLAQITALYGDRARTVVNNHRALLFGRGINDLDTLQLVSDLIGDAPSTRWQHSHDLTRTGGRSVAEHTTWRPQAAPDVLRRLRPDHALVVYGAEPAFQVALRPWFRRHRTP